MEIGTRLRQLREAVGITQSQLGQLIGCSKQRIYCIESGDASYRLRMEELATLKKYGLNAVGYVNGDPDPFIESFDVARARVQGALARIAEQV